MKKRKIILPITAFVTMMMVGVTAYAAVCPPCEMAGVHTQCTTQGTHLWHASYTHDIRYSYEGVLYTETCSYMKTEDKVEWICPQGHGVVSSKIHHVEKHSNTHCQEGLDYYY